MKFKTLIVDDELEAQKRLLLHLGKFESLQLIGADQNGKAALKSIKRESPDIVFLDVEMPEMSGIEVLAHCDPPFPYIVFVTAYSQYAVEAFEQNAVDYVLKPYTFERIEQAVERAVEIIKKDRLSSVNENFKDLLFALNRNTGPLADRDYIKRIAVKSIGKTIFIPVEDIVFIEAADQYIEVYTEKNKFTVRESMDALERNLDPALFFRTHRSFIVSLDHVSALENVDKHISIVILKNGKRLKIANNRKQEFKSRMGF